MARRDHPPGVPVRHRPGPPRRRPGDRRAGRRPGDRDARPGRRGRRSPAIEPEPGWTVEASLTASTGRSTRGGVVPLAAGRRAWPSDPAERDMFGATRRAGRSPTRRRELAGVDRRLEPPLGRLVHVAPRGPGRRRLVGRAARASTTLVVRLRSPDGAVVEEATVRVGFRRVEIVGLDLLDQRRPRLPPRRQPPRLRPAHRPGHLASSRCAPTSC